MTIFVSTKAGKKYLSQLILFSFSLLLAYPILAGTPCHPLPIFWKAQYIVGYGSLLNEASKQQTCSKVGKNVPIFLTGYARRWNADVHSYRYLGVSPSMHEKISAVYFQIDLNQIFLFDRREQVYCRVELSPAKRFMPLTNHKISEGQYWLYVPKYPTEAENDNVKTGYQEIFMRACKKIAKEVNSPAYYKSCLKVTQKKRPA